MTDRARLRILALPAKAFPCDHAMLETVLATMLPDHGHDVQWVMASSDGTAGPVPWHGSIVHAVAGARGGPVSRIRANARLLRTAWNVGRDGEFDIVFVRNAVRLAWVALWLRRKAGPRFVFQISFPVAERTAMLAGRRPGVARVRGLTAALAVRARGLVARRADLVLAISERMRRELEAGGVAPGRIAVLPLAAEPTEPSPAAVREVREDLALEDRPLVLYFGAIAPERRLDLVVDAAAAAAPRHPEATWVLIGPSASGEAERLRARASSLGAPVAVLDPVPRDRIPAYLAAATLTLSPIPPDPLFAVASPTKVAESLAAGVPVVGTPIEDQAELLTRSGGGLVTAFDPRAVADAVCGLLDDPGRIRDMGAAGLAYVSEHRSWRGAADELERRLIELAAIGDRPPVPS